jgi:hypothetical protein
LEERRAGDVEQEVGELWVMAVGRRWSGCHGFLWRRSTVAAAGLLLSCGCGEDDGKKRTGKHITNGSG